MIGAEALLLHVFEAGYKRRSTSVDEATMGGIVFLLGVKGGMNTLRGPTILSFTLTFTPPKIFRR